MATHLMSSHSHLAILCPPLHGLASAPQKSYVSDYSQVMDEAAGSSMDQVANIVAQNAKTSPLASSGTLYGTMVLDTPLE